MNPVALFRFFKEHFAKCRCIYTNLYKGRDRPVFTLLNAIDTVLRKLGTRKETCRAIDAFFITIFGSLFSNLGFSVDFGTCMCCGGQMIVECSTAKVKKYCSDQACSISCQYNKKDGDLKSCLSEKCPIRSAGENVLEKNALIVSFITSIILLNIDMHGDIILNADADCKNAMALLILRFRNLRYAITDDEKMMFATPNEKLVEFKRVRIEGKKYTLAIDDPREVKERIGAMPGYNHFTFTIPPFLSGPISRRKLARMR